MRDRPGRRRCSVFLCLALAVLVCPVAVSAQQPGKIPRLGFLAWAACPGPASVFGKALQERGYPWGDKIQVVCRSAQGSYEGLSDAAAALAGEKVDVLVGLTHIAAYALQRATRSTPIVMIASGDPVRTGLAASLARPGRNVTGVTYYSTELSDKRLQLLKEIVPQASRIAVLTNTLSDHVFGMYREDAERAAGALGFQLIVADARDPRDLEQIFETFARKGAQGLMVLTDPMLRVQAGLIAALAEHHRLPAIYGGPWFLEAGGLASYSADFDHMTRRAAYYVDRILKGASPATLPIEQPTKFDLTINLKAARALGLTIPETLLARAHRLIEE